MDYMLRGILIGLLFGLPVGAVGTMTVQRTWNGGIKAGLFTGLGSSVSDCFYAVVGAFGLTLISDFLLKYQVVINILGCGFVLFLGIRLLMKKEDTAGAKVETMNPIKMFLSSFAVGITNPAATLTFLFALRFKMKSKLLQLFTDNSLPGTNSQNKPDVSSDGVTSDNRPNSSDSSNTQQAKPPVESTSPGSQPSDNSTTEENTVKKMNLQIGNNSFTATLENNEGGMLSWI